MLETLNLEVKTSYLPAGIYYYSLVGVFLFDCVFVLPYYNNAILLSKMQIYNSTTLVRVELSTTCTTLTTTSKGHNFMV